MSFGYTLVETRGIRGLEDVLGDIREAWGRLGEVWRRLRGSLV